MKVFTTQKAGNIYLLSRFLGAVIMVALLASTAAISLETLNLRSTANFVILAGSTITGIPPVAIKGNVGLSPAAGSNITGFDGSKVNGILYVVDASGPAGSVQNATLLQTAKSDLTIAYNDAAGRTPVPTGDYLNPGAGNIGGLNLGPGLYKFTSSAAITGANVTLTGSATDVWIFQIASSLNVGSDIHIILAGGAQAANIFWQVGTSATLGTYSVFKGTILADQSISMGTGASIDGRALAFEAAVTFGSGVNTNISDLKLPIFSGNLNQLAFNNVGVGLNKMDSVTITNTGNADLVISSVTSSNTSYTVSPANGTITPGSSRKFYVTFAPLAVGLNNGFIYFNHNAGKSKDSITVSGSGVSSDFSISPSSLNFGLMSIGLSKRDSVTITNNGTVALIISSVSSSNASFTVTPANGTITPGSSRKFYVTFAPTTVGLKNGRIYFNHNAANGKDSISVSGTGVANSLSFSAKSLNFGEVNNGLSKMDSITITNNGSMNLIISSIKRSNTLFAVTPSTAVIKPGESKKFYFTFAPLADGVENGYFYFYHNFSKTSDTISVSGTGVSSNYSFSPASLNFGTVNNANTKMDSVTITNTGTTNLVITGFTSGNTHFTVQEHIVTIAPGSSKVIHITFTPLTSGLHEGYILIRFNASNENDSIHVTGLGEGSNVYPIFTINRLSLDFGNVGSGLTKLDSVIITNTGTANLIIWKMASNNPFYQLDRVTAIITAGSSQKIYVTFSPLKPGFQEGYIYFYHNATNKKDSVYVKGTGTGNDISPVFISITNLDFGTVFIGNTEQRSFIVSNEGTTQLNISDISINDPHYIITPLLGTIGPGEYMIFHVTFAPTAVSRVDAKIVFTHNAGSNTINVTGKGLSNTNVITIKAARALPIGTEFVIEGIVTRTMGNYTRIQDNTGAITIIQATGVFSNEVQNFDIQMEDKLRVQGKISEIGGLKVINGSDLEGHQRLSRLNDLPAPVKVTLSDINSNGELYESHLITLEGLSVVSGGDLIFNELETYQVTDASDNSNKVVIRIGASEDTDIDGMPFIGTSVTFIGVLSQSSVSNPTSGYQLTPVLPFDLNNDPTDALDLETGNQYSLSSNYPNPFNSTTTVQYSIGNSGLVMLKVFNILGQEVATIVNGFKEAGTHIVTFQAPEGGSGLYYYRMESGNFVATKQFMLVK